MDSFLTDPRIIAGFSAMQYRDEEENKNYSDMYRLLLKSRIVLLGRDINTVVANVIIAGLLYLEQQDEEQEIKLYINSPGGAVEAGLAIYDTIQLLKPQVSTLCIGMTASFATVLLAAGAKGKRAALPNSTIHMHQPLGAAAGQSVDVEIFARRMVKMREKLYAILSRHTGKSVEKIAQDCDRDFFLDPEEAIGYGLIDHVLTRDMRIKRLD